MAVWQFSFWAVPEMSLIKQAGSIPDKISEKEFNELIWFEEYSQIEELIYGISFLKPNKHWHEETVFFGDYKSNSISMAYSNKKLEDIYIRLDLRGEYILILKKVLLLLKANNLLIISEDLNIFEPELKVISAEIERYICSKRSLFQLI